MPLKVPTYTQSVEPQTAAAPSLPAIPSAPPAAFGTDVAAAQERLGRSIQGAGQELTDYMVERNRQMQQAQIIKADTDFRRDLQNTMFSTDEMDKPDPSDPNKTVQVPSGVFNRELGQASGATQDFDSAYGQLRQKYLSKFSNPVQQNEMARLMDENYTHHRQLVIHHEATQMRENEKNIVEGNLKQMVNDAGKLTDPQAFMQQLEVGQQRQFANMKENGFDEASISTASDKFATDMARSAITPVIGSDPTAAYKYLDSIKSALTPTVVAGLKKEIDVQSRQLAELERFQKKQQYDANMRQAMLDMFDGKLTLSEAERRYRNDQLDKGDYDTLEAKLVKPDYQILRDMTVSDPDTFNSIRSAQLSGEKSPGEITRMIAQGHVDGKITADDGQYLDKMTKNLPPDPRDTEIATQAKGIEDFANRYYAQTVGDQLPFSVPSKISDIPVKKEETQKEVSNIMSDFYKRVDKENAQGDRINQIAHEVMSQHVRKRFPELSRLSDIPHIVVGIDGKVQRLLAPGQATKLKGQFRVTRGNGNKDVVQGSDTTTSGEDTGE